MAEYVRAVNLAFGGVGIALLSGAGQPAFLFDERYTPFLSTDKPQITLELQYGSLPHLDLGRALFDTHLNWSLHRVEERWVYVLRSPGDQVVRSLVLLEPGLDKGEVHILPAPGVEQIPYFPLSFPLAELLMVMLLSRGRGVLLHACGIDDRGEGLLFSGVSGAGKSTTSRLWAETPGATLLSDDRIIVTRRDQEFWMYGTPWHGDARVVSPLAAPLEQVYVLKHAQYNQAIPLGPQEATKRLLVRSFPTYWDAEGMSWTLSFLAELCERVPCHELSFLPDPSAVEYVRCARSALSI